MSATPFSLLTNVFGGGQKPVSSELGTRFFFWERLETIPSSAAQVANRDRSCENATTALYSSLGKEDA